MVMVGLDEDGNRFVLHDDGELEFVSKEEWNNSEKDD